MTVADLVLTEALKAAVVEFGPSAAKMPDHPNVLNFIAGFKASEKRRRVRIARLEAELANRDAILVHLAGMDDLAARRPQEDL